jgi:hypothetical protein
LEKKAEQILPGSKGDGRELEGAGGGGGSGNLLYVQCMHI